MSLILFLPALVLTILLLVVIAKSILGPISRAAGSLNLPVQFRLSDFLWLVVQLQIVLGLLVHQIDTNVVQMEPFGFGVILMLLLGSTFGLWAGAVSCVSKAGVTHAWRRGVFIIVVLPLTLVVMIALPSVLFVAMAVAINQLDNWQAPAKDFSMTGVLVAAASGLAAAGWVLRLISRWVLVGNQQPKELSGSFPLKRAAS